MSHDLASYRASHADHSYDYIWSTALYAFAAFMLVVTFVSIFTEPASRATPATRLVVAVLNATPPPRTSASAAIAVRASEIVPSTPNVVNTVHVVVGGFSVSASIPGVRSEVCLTYTIFTKWTSANHACGA